MIAKLRGRTFAELRGRLVQLGRAMAERRGFMPEALVPPQLTLTPRTPWGACDAGAMRREVPGQQQHTLITRADRIVGGTFDVLGLRGVSYGTPVNWQRDPLAGRSASLVHWSRVPYLDHEQVGDHKVTWELNRHQWLITLGQAWVLSGDERYANTAARLLREWLTANPPKQGINWCSALELAFRVQSWIHGLRLFDGAGVFHDTLRHDLVASAALQIDHVARNLSTWFSPNTHLTGEALALLSAGCAWPDLPQAAQWRELGWRILCDELPKQVRGDGVYFEQSAWYQAYTVDFYLVGLSWATLAGLPVPSDMRDRLRAAARALRAITRPDGTIARLGDDDGGHTLPYTPLPFGDMTASLWRAAWLLDDSSLIPPTVEGRSTLLWLEGVSAFAAMTDCSSGDQRSNTAFREGGWITLVERGNTPEGDHWLVLDGGPHGALSHAHSHADALGIDLSVHGVPVFVDPGTGAYVGSLRRKYRSTSVHNTVTVDGADSSEQGTSFTWRSATDTLIEGFGTAESASFVAAFHDGYRRLADPVRHHRTILRLDRRYWLMLDTIDSLSAHHVATTLQCAAGARVTQHSAQRFEIETDGAHVQVAFDARLTGRIESRTVSPAYALELSAPGLVATANLTGATVLCTAIGADDESGALSVANEGAQAWRISHRNGVDLVCRPAGATVTVGPAAFDGTAMIIVGADEPQRIVAAGEGTLHLAGRAFTLGADDILVARRALDGTWTTES